MSQTASPHAAGPRHGIDPRLVVVAAVARNGVIGGDNAMPWRLPEDLRRFKAMTTGAPVIMGRRTFESIGRALAGRLNIVVSRSLAAPPPGCSLAGSLNEALAAAGDAPRIFIIGGGQLYAQALPRAARMSLTEIDADYPGDTLFPPIDRRAWSETSRESRISAGPPPLRYAFVEYVRTG